MLDLYDSHEKIEGGLNDVIRKKVRGKACALTRSINNGRNLNFKVKPLFLSQTRSVEVLVLI